MGQEWKALQINRKDNVAVALEDIPSGVSVVILDAGQTVITALQPVSFAHKISITAIKKGQPILKYGVPIAFATTEISAGEWVHVHNAQSYFVEKRMGEKP